ncbi:MAG: acyltransferase, partial [Muribaculaceae bacterium]|nr:acyltransferase [Muribaculaceae bacterium]
YEIFKMNYIAYDQLNETDRFAYQYSFDDIVDFDNYISAQLDKVDVDDITEEEDMFMRDLMLQMYANPLANKLVAIGEDSEEE